MIKMEFKKKMLSKKGITWGEIGEFILKTLDSIKSKKGKVAFLCKTHGLVLENYALQHMQKKGKIIGKY